MGVDNRKFACDWPDCRKSFLHAENLTSHRRQHTDPKPFHCELCPLGYWQKSSLRSHRRKAHGSAPPPTTPALNDISAPSSAHISSTGWIVDGIIRSVTASMQAASSCETRPCSGNDDSDVRPSAVVETLFVSESGPPTAVDIRPPTSVNIQHVRQCLSTELVLEEGIQLMRDDDESTQRSGGYDMTLPASDADTTKLREGPSTDKSSQLMNVYEFCDDDSVNISHHKPPRGATAVLRTGIELQPTTIELNDHYDDDDDDHDLIAFDDDMSPTVDRLSETVITYSRKKKQSIDSENKAAGFNKPLSTDVTTATRKSSKRKSSVAGHRRKRTGVVELEVACEERVKRKVRRKRAVDGVSDSDAIHKQLCDSSATSQMASVARTSKRSKKEKTSAGGVVLRDSNRAKKLSAADKVVCQSVKSDAVDRSARTGYRKKRKRKSDEVESEKPGESVETSATNVYVTCNGREESRVTETSVDRVTVTSADRVTETSADRVTVTSADHNIADRATTRKVVRRRRTRTTRQSLRNDVDDAVKEDEAAESATRPQSPLENVDLAVNSVCNDDGGDRDVDIAACGSGVELSEAGPAADCLSDNTEILSLNDNVADDVDEGEVTRRSSPASYRSDECEPHMMLPAHQHSDDSSGDSTSHMCYVCK